MLVLTVPNYTVGVGPFVELARAEGLLYLFDARTNAAFQAGRVDIIDVLDRTLDRIACRLNRCSA